MMTKASDDYLMDAIASIEKLQELCQREVAKCATGRTPCGHFRGGVGFRPVELRKTSPPTENEIALLMSFPGAGVLKEKGVFNAAFSGGILPPETCLENTTNGVRQASLKIQSLVTESDWISLRNSGMLNSHYTSADIIKFIWGQVEPHLNTGDKVLDPGCGTGGFFYHKPEEINIQYFGVENDPLACAIAKNAHSHMGAKFYQWDFTDWVYPGQFQAIVGNVPFTNGNNWFKRGGLKLNIGLHSQFFFVACGLLKPGGVMAMLTSTSTLDARGKDYLALREYLARQCELVRAIRLPCNAGVYIGKTEVTTDLIVLQKRDRPLDETPDCGWINVVDSGLIPPSGDDRIYINQWFLRHPRYLMGLPVVSSLRGKNGNPAYRFAVELEEDKNLMEELTLLETTKETPAMANNSDNNWQAFQIKYVDKKGVAPGCDAIQIHFPDKPTQTICDALGKVGYKFHSNGTKYWYAYLTPKIEKWTLEVLLKKYAPFGAAIACPKVGVPSEPSSEEKPPSSGGGIGEMMAMMREMYGAITQLSDEVQEMREATTHKPEFGIEDLKEEAARREVALEEAMNTIDKLRDEVTQKDKEVLGHKNRIDEQNDAISIAKNSSSYDKQIISELTSQRDAALDEGAGLRRAMDVLKREHLDEKSVLEEEIASLSRKIDQCESVIDTQRSQLNEWGLSSNKGDVASTVEEELPSLDDEDELPSLDDEEDVQYIAEEYEIESWDEVEGDDDSKNV